MPGSPCTRDPPHPGHPMNQRPPCPGCGIPLPRARPTDAPCPTVSNAGVGMAGPLECQSLAAMQSLMDTNFFGLVRLVKEVLPDMKRRRGGHIVVISSIMGLQGIVFNDIYSASKFAVEGFCESLVVQALRFNVAISLVEPGPVMTEFETKLYEEAERADYSRTDPETAEIFTKLYLRNSRDVFTSLGQTPEDIAEVTAARGAPGTKPQLWETGLREDGRGQDLPHTPPASRCPPVPRGAAMGLELGGPPALPPALLAAERGGTGAAVGELGNTW
uniref:Retinol dehydrogenase 8 n=5 Tax=Passeriformes TaxID=9126 RepID=A0A8D2MEP6_ZONAL